MVCWLSSHLIDEVLHDLASQSCICQLSFQLESCAACRMLSSAMSQLRICKVVGACVRSRQLFVSATYLATYVLPFSHTIAGGPQGCTIALTFADDKAAKAFSAREPTQWRQGVIIAWDGVAVLHSDLVEHSVVDAHAQAAHHTG